MPDSDPIINPISKTLRRLVIATVVLWLALVGVGGFAYREAEKNGDALCALRADLEKRVENSERFLSEHPKGIPGIPARTIQDGIDNQRRTILALSGLSC